MRLNVERWGKRLRVARVRFDQRLAVDQSAGSVETSDFQKEP
jgi:hypothetical protein